MPATPATLSPRSSAGPGPANPAEGVPSSATTAARSGASRAAASGRRSRGPMPPRTAGRAGRPATANCASRASLRRGRGGGSGRAHDRARSRRRQATFVWCGEREDVPTRPDLPEGGLRDGALGLQQLGVLRPARENPAASAPRLAAGLRARLRTLRRRLRDGEREAPLLQRPLPDGGVRAAQTRCWRERKWRAVTTDWLMARAVDRRRSRVRSASHRCLTLRSLP